jgi:hypothetical protein
MLVLLLVSISYCISGILAVVGLPSAVNSVMFLFSLLLLDYLHAVAGLTVFASIPAFDCVHHTMFAVLLLLTFLLLLAFLLLRS